MDTYPRKEQNLRQDQESNRLACNRYQRPGKFGGAGRHSKRLGDHGKKAGQSQHRLSSRYAIIYKNVNKATCFICLFISGRDPNLIEALKAEADAFGDMAITDNYDTYTNLSLKTLSAFDFMTNFCPQAEFLLKTDDDMFINVNSAISHIKYPLKINYLN